MISAISFLSAPALAAGTLLPAPAIQPDIALLSAPQANGTIVETAIAAGRFNTLVTAVSAAGLVDTLNGPGPFTVFAPTDEAFAKVPADRLSYLLEPGNVDKLTSILTFHVVADSLGSGDVVNSDFVSTVNGQRAYIEFDGTTAMIENATIIFTDIQCSNGIIHVIDEVIFPELQTIPGVAARSGQFDTLLTALQITKLDDDLAGDGPFTVFAPTDDAFRMLPPGALDALAKDPRALADVLGFHVTLGRLYADDVVAAGMLSMLNGDMTTITTSTSGVFIENAQIIVTDIQAANGVIHVIDAVMIP